MTSNYKDYLIFSTTLDIGSENNLQNHILCSDTHTIIFDKPGVNDDETIYFLKLEKMYLGKMSFPIQMNSLDEEVEIYYALMHYDKNANNNYYRLKAEEIDTPGNLLANESVVSHSYFCNRINTLTINYVNSLDKNLYDNLYVPCFDVCNGKLSCTYLVVEGNKNNYPPYVIGFDNNIFNLVGKYFDTEWGKNDPDDEDKFFIIHPYHGEEKWSVNDLDAEEYSIIAAHQTDDFFYPERNLIVEMTRDTNTHFLGNESSYKKFSFPFRNKEGIVELSKNILIANNTTIRESLVTSHNFRLSIEIDEEFHCNEDLEITVTGKLIPLKDIYDQFSLFNLNIYDLYTDEQYQMLSYKQIMGMQADKVYVQNQENTKVLKELRDLMQSIFDPFTDKDDCNIPRVLRRIYDILCQTQDITNMGPPLKQKIKYSVDL